MCIIGISVAGSLSAADLNETAADLDESIDEDEISIEEIENNHEDKLSQSEDCEIISANYTPKTSSEIQSFVNSANAGDTIVLDGYYLINNTIRVNKQLNFIGINDATIEGNFNTALFGLGEKNSVFKNIIFKNGYSSSGGAIGGICTVINCIFINNSAARYGGALYECNAYNCTFINNSAVYGGAVYDTNIENCTFINNTAQYGGAWTTTSMYISSDYKILSCYFEGNKATSRGGALRYGNAVNCSFSNNTSVWGGAIFEGSAVNSSFINNYATGSTEGGSAIHGGSAVNCNFSYNHATYGGAVQSTKIINCTFISNTATNSGGAVFEGSALNCSFYNNSAKWGGAVFRASVENCTFINNSASQGGALYIGTSAKGSTFINNHASEDGGAMYGGNALNCTFVSNYASGSGGALYSSIVENCTFTNNSATNGGAVEGGKVSKGNFITNSAVNGGAIYECSEIVNCSFISNHASDSGGALYCSIVFNSTFINNSAANNGGAIYGDEDMTATNCNFTNNTAKNGGASYRATLVNCKFSTNNATLNGGALYGGFAVNCTFYANHADADGGAVYDVQIAHSTFEYNTAGNNGGAMNGVKASNCTFYSNRAGNYGGAVSNSIVTSNSKFNNNYAKHDNDMHNSEIVDIKTLADLNTLINGNNLAEIYLESNYTFDYALDYDLREGIVVNRSVKIYGNSFTINGSNFARIFKVLNENVTFRDIFFINAKSQSDGGAVNGVCTIVNCTFINNSAVNGGALYGCNAINCTFRDNHASDCGGVLYGGSALNCTFIHNSAYRAGALYKGSAVNCSFVNNSANDAGALYVSIATNCTFVNNSANYGGAMYGGRAYNSTFKLNHVIYDGGATYDTDSYNCSFVNNYAYQYGGAMYYGNALNCTFVNNSARFMGGATMSVNAVGCLFIKNYNTNSASYSDWGGGAMNRGTAINCTFINNTSISYGGALSSVMYVENCTFINNSANRGGAINLDSAINCTFYNNHANIHGGALFSVSAVNCKFIQNSADSGAGAIYGGSAVNCSFYNNSANYAGALYDTAATDCTFLNNRASGSGGAITGGSALNCTFVNNSAGNGGAVSFCISVVNCSFVNNSASDSGGAIYSVVSVVNCSFVNNFANNGGAIKGSYYDVAPASYHKARIDNCTFVNNSASKGGAVIAGDEVVNCIFINNSATFGGSICGVYDIYYNNGYSTGLIGTYYSQVNNCTFINSTADYGGAMYSGNALNCRFINDSADYGGAIYINSNMTVTYCNFTDCFANFKGGAIYINQSGNVTYCNFINCSSNEDTCLAANSSSNYSILNCIFDKYPTNIDYHYVSSLISANLTYFNGEEGILIADLSDMRGALNNRTVYILINDRKYNATTDSEGSAYFNIPSYLNKAGVYNATLIYEGDNVIDPSSFNLTVTVNKHVAVLNASDLVLFKNEYGTLVANLSNIRGPLAGKQIIFTVNGRTRSLTTDENGLVDFNVINFVSSKGEYAVNISFAGDDFNYPVSKNISFIYVDYKGVLTGSVDGKYYNDTVLSFNLINYRNNKPINGETIRLSFSNGETVYLTTDVDGNAVYRIPFVPDYYDVVAGVDGEFISVNNVSFKEIEINKIFGVIEHSLLNGNKTIKFKLSHRYNGDSLRNINLKLIFSNGEEAEITTDNEGVATYDIPFPKGIYSVSVTVIGDYKDFEPDPDYISNIAVSNDLNSSINFTNNITFDFGEYGSTNYTVDGGVIGNVCVINHTEAKISITNDQITVFGLAVGKYVLLVETSPDDYHNPVTSTLNITVNSVKSKVTFSAGVAFEYGGSATIHVTVDGGSVNSKSIQVVGHSEAKITFVKDMITVSNLNPGSYTLRVESIPDSDHMVGEGTIGITVRKATAVIKASKLTVALKSGALWTIKLVDSKYGKPISNMKVTLKVYTGKKFKTVTLTTNSKGEANYRTSSLTKGTHKVVVSGNHYGYNFNTLTSSISVIKPKKLSFKVKKNIAKDGSSLSITVKKGKKPINGIKIKLLVYTGKKYKTITLKTKTNGKYKGVCGWGTNKLTVGTHKIVIMPVSIKYSGSKTVKMTLKKSAKKYPNWETKI